jgi:hypothetical protein
MGASFPGRLGANPGMRSMERKSHALPRAPLYFRPPAA